MEEMGRQSTMKLEMLTVDHHLVGYVTTGARRFSTWLNLVSEPTFTLDNAIVRSLEELDAAEIPLEFVLVERRAVVAAIPREPPVTGEATERGGKPLEYVEKMRREIVVTLPPFALRGHIHLAKGADLRRVLATSRDAFMPFSEARLVYTVNPRLLWEGEVILVNRSKAQLYWPSPDLDAR